MGEFALEAVEQRLLDEAKARIEAQMARLRETVPYVLDMSSREAALSSTWGHTLRDKTDLFELGREIGLEDFGLSNFYAFPSVSDQFLDHLLANDVPLDPFFVTIAVEPVGADGEIAASPAAQRTAEAEIPNVIHLSSGSLCSLSYRLKAMGSRNTVAASSKLTSCLDLLD